MFFTAIYFHFITRDPSIIHYPGTYQIIQKQGILFFLLNKTLVFPPKRKERKKKNFTKIQGPVGVWVQWNGDFVERKKEKKNERNCFFFLFFFFLVCKFSIRNISRKRCKNADGINKSRYIISLHRGDAIATAPTGGGIVPVPVPVPKKKKYNH